MRASDRSSLNARRFWFETHGETHTCPCCGVPSLRERAVGTLCVVCWWHDEGFDDESDDQYSMNNQLMTLDEARTRVHEQFRPIRETKTTFPLDARAREERARQALLATCDALVHGESPNWMALDQALFAVPGQNGRVLKRFVDWLRDAYDPAVVRAERAHA